MAKLTTDELKQILSEAAKRVVVGGKYVHYKSSESIYTVLELVIIEATNEAGVVYQPNYGDSGDLKFLRPINVFLEEVDTENGKVQRFKLAE
jgi:hypothetical protein